MSEIPFDPEADARRIARRLSRLFRIERSGGFDRRPAATVRRIVERRDALIDALIAFQRQHEEAPTAAFLRSLAELADEVRYAQEYAEAQIVRLRMELGLRRGDGRPTGLRGGADGQLLGRG